MSKNKNQEPDFDDDMPPELEDIPEDALPNKEASKNKTARQGNLNLGDYAQAKPEVSTLQIVQKEETKAEEPKKKESFGGMKGGFFNAKPKSESKKTPQPKKEESNIVEIKPTQKKDSKVLDEVQEAMKVNQSLIDKKDEWMNQELLTKFAKNPKLTQLFTNPECMQAISLMQKNPKEAMARYGGNPEFREMLIEFSRIMGDHFEKLSEQAPKTQTPDTNTANQLPRDPKAEEILKDQKVQYLIQYLQKNPKLDFNMVLRQDPDLAQKVKYLIDKGYFQIQAS